MGSHNNELDQRLYRSAILCARDEESQFQNIFAILSAIHEVYVKKSGIQSHHSLGVGERYREGLRDTYLLNSIFTIPKCNGRCFSP